MMDLFKKLTGNQYSAAFSTLKACIVRCPEPTWDEPVGNLEFCQVAFHTLFFSDLYLGPDEHSLRGQQFHRDYKDHFRDYEELEDRPQQLRYGRSFLVAYLEHCREKAPKVIADETSETLNSQCRFPWLKLCRAELHVYNIRHIQHHSAQLSLRLRIDHREDIPWFGSGWRNTL